MSANATRRKRRRRGSGLWRWAAGVVAAALLFAVGIAVGQALEEGPDPAKPVTSFATIEPWTQTERATVTVASP